MQTNVNFILTRSKFLGHVIDTAGIHPDPDKVSAIQQLKAPTNVTELRRFLGMVTYLGKFTSNLSQKVKPLRDLLSKENQWVWGDTQQTAFLQIKQELSDGLCMIPVEIPWSLLTHPRLVYGQY